MVYQKKSLGQNFLKSEKALSDIIDAADPSGDDIILEVGPGEGVLTERLLKFAGKVIAVEKDARLIPILKERFAKEINEGKLDLIEKDILEFDPEVLRFYGHPYKIIANIPYYITGLFFRKFLESAHQPEQMVILIQKEVADRIVANDGKESILSLSIKAYGDPRRVAVVKAGSFSPPPKVDSAVISIENISRDKFAGVKEEKFFEIIKKAFNQKRKMLSNTLSEMSDKIESCGIPQKSRPEDLPLEKWLCLARE